MAKDQGDRARQERLAAELRANLQKRKAQARARRAGEADRRDEGIKAASDGTRPQESGRQDAGPARRRDGSD